MHFCWNWLLSHSNLKMWSELLSKQVLSFIVQWHKILGGCAMHFKKVTWIQNHQNKKRDRNFVFTNSHTKFHYGLPGNFGRVKFFCSERRLWENQNWDGWGFVLDVWYVAENRDYSWISEAIQKRWLETAWGSTSNTPCLHFSLLTPSKKERVKATWIAVVCHISSIWQLGMAELRLWRAKANFFAQTKFKYLICSEKY